MAGSVDSGREAQHLVELLAVVSMCEDEHTATLAAIECAAMMLEAEASALVVDGRVVASIGFCEGGSDHDVLAGVPAGKRDTVVVPGLGMCSAGSAALGDATMANLVIARSGEELTVHELNLLRGMARVLGLTLRMLRTLDAERRRQRTMQHLYGVQRAISRRTPLQDILDMVAAGAHDILGGERDAVHLWLVDPHQAGRLLPVSSAGAVAPGDVDVASLAVREERLVADGAGSAAAPVYESGAVAGSLAITRADGRDLTGEEAEKLLAFAEHVSIAVTDAKTVRDMNQAMHDSLTGLASRPLFLDRLGAELGRTRGRGLGRTALLFIDLDRFKQVNDTLGHAAGDMLLVGVADRLRGILREGDVAARFGGDEFAVMLAGVRFADQAVEIADRIIEVLTQPFPVLGGRAEVSASVGVAFAATGHDDILSDPEDLLSGPDGRLIMADGEFDGAAEIEELMRRADVAMYRAKRAGRGRSMVWGWEMDAGSPDDDTQAADVRRVIDALTQAA